jgi:cell division protein FtsI (penicillin-binding protein 3)
VRNLDPRRARWIRTRMGILCGLMGLALGAIVESAWRIQVEDGAQWRELAEKQRQRRLRVEPKRGTIYDRNGVPLAVSVEVPSVTVDVGEMLRGVDGATAQESVLRDAAVRLGQVLSMSVDEVYSKLEPRRRFVWLKRRITSDEAAAVRDLSDPKKQRQPLRGVTIEGEGHRYYPGRELAAQVLGFVAPDGQGKDGIELALDDELRGKAENVRGVRDRSGRLIFDGAGDGRALRGDDVVLSLDEGVQHTVERELDTAVRTYETKGGSLVVVDPFTGEILALANVPSYNPNDYSESDPDARRNRAITDRFEPGSVMKTFTVAAALAAGTLKPTMLVDCEHGAYQIGGTTIHDTHLNGLLTPTQILARSSNIGAVKIGLELGESSLYATYRRLGFGESTGVPLPGESAGVLRPKGRPWYDVETASASFGQGITVTALQLAMAMSAIANGGRLLEPILVKKVISATGERRDSSVHLRREVVPWGVAKTVAEMLTAVTENGGTGVEAAIAGLRVAGKTSTAQKVDPATGKYSTEKYTAIFVGFVPVEHPRVVVAVVLDEPVIGRYGGDLAGPVFRRVAEASLRYLGASPATGAMALAAAKPDVAPTDASPEAAKVSSADSARSGAEKLDGADGIRVPDATGMAARDVVLMLTKAGWTPQMEGWGRVVRQSPAPGSLVPKGGAVHLVLEPAS